MDASPRFSNALRREYVLARLREADGITYDQLCGEVVAAFPEDRGWLASVRAVRAARKLLFEGFATTEPDETIWLTADGWQRAGGAR
jgi:hypothetical protein